VVHLFFVRSVEDVPVAKETECEKSNGDGNQNAPECKLVTNAEKNEEADENVISNGIKSTDVVSTDEKLVVTAESELPNLEAADKATTGLVDSDADHEQECDEKTDAENEQQPKSPSLPNGLSHKEEESEGANDRGSFCAVDRVDEAESELAPVNHQVSDVKRPVTGSESSQAHETVSAMDVDENPMDEPMETSTAAEPECKLESKPVEDDNLDKKTAEQMTAKDREETFDEFKKTVELEVELTQPAGPDLPTSEKESSMPQASPKDDKMSSPVSSENTKQGDVDEAVQPGSTKEDEVTPSPPPHANESAPCTASAGETKCDNESNVNVKVEGKVNEESTSADRQSGSVESGVVDQVVLRYSYNNSFSSRKYFFVKSTIIKKFSQIM
jgi:hypothetical protein